MSSYNRAIREKALLLESEFKGHQMLFNLLSIYGTILQIYTFKNTAVVFYSQVGEAARAQDHLREVAMKGGGFKVILDNFGGAIQNSHGKKI